MNPYVFVVEADLELRADRAILEWCQDQDELQHLTRNQIQKLIDSGNITMDSKSIRSKDLLKAGSRIEIILPAARRMEIEPENIPIELLYEDEFLAVVNKPPGLTVHPSDHERSGTLVNALLFHMKDLSGIGGIMRPGIVHRIDKNTSGALVISKTDLAHAGLAAQFAKHSINRKYWAWVYGCPNWELGPDGTTRIETILGRSPNDRKKMAVNGLPGRKAISRFKPLEFYSLPNKNSFAAKVEARLETGRTHQVRVHLNHLGHSCLGDPTYGTPTENQSKWKILPKPIQEKVSQLVGQALHAHSLGFIHPISKKELYFEANMPISLIQLEHELRPYSV
jgi:23S rRNA pseudouridine1911/1915/1917 synthase